MYFGDIFLVVHTGQPVWNSLWIWPWSLLKSSKNQSFLRFLKFAVACYCTKNCKSLTTRQHSFETQRTIYLSLTNNKYKRYFWFPNISDILPNVKIHVIYFFAGSFDLLKLCHNFRRSKDPARKYITCILQTLVSNCFT